MRTTHFARNVGQVSSVITNHMSEFFKCSCLTKILVWSNFMKGYGYTYLMSVRQDLLRRSGCAMRKSLRCSGARKYSTSPSLCSWHRPNLSTFHSLAQGKTEPYGWSSSLLLQVQHGWWIVLCEHDLNGLCNNLQKERSLLAKLLHCVMADAAPLKYGTWGVLQDPSEWNS